MNRAKGGKAMHASRPFDSADELAFFVDSGSDSGDGEGRPSRLRDEILSTPPLMVPVPGTVISMRSLDGLLTISLGDGVDAQSIKARLAAGESVPLLVKLRDAPTEVGKPSV